MKTKQNCPIWETPASVEDLDYPVKKIDSPRAGGKFISNDLVINFVKSLSVEEKTKLTNWIVDQNRFDSVLPELTLEIIEQCKQAREISVFERADRLLMFLSQGSNRVGKRITFKEQAVSEFSIVQPGEDVSSFFEEHPEYLNYLRMLSWGGATEFEEIFFLLDFLSDQCWINRKAGSRTSIVAPKGYARLAELNNNNPFSDQCFVAMWFDDSMQSAYNEGIEPAIRDSGYKALRIDKKEHANKIDDEIIAEIRRSRFVVADFTSKLNTPRGGVYYEAGFAQGLNIPVLWSCRGDMIEHVHFDTRQFNHIVWDGPADLREKLTNRIGAVIGDGPNKLKL